MNVKDLIEQLEQFDKKTNVTIVGGYNSADIEEIIENKNEITIVSE